MDTGAVGMNGRREEPRSDGSSQAHAEALQREIEGIRGDLANTVGELDRRRHDLLDVRGQLRRHPVPITLLAVALLALAAGGIALAVNRRHRKQQLGARLERLREALGRMVAQPNRVATDPGVGRKIVAAAGGAAASLTAKKLVAKFFREQASKQQADA
jgi:hypothetical protein